jgi:molybdate transport system substrate-binding protein
LRPVVGVRRGNPRAIRSLADLTRGDVRLALANPDTAAVGRLARERLRDVGRWDAVRARAIVTRPTVGDVANDVKLGAADAAFVWDANVAQMPELKAVTLPEFAGVESLLA